MSKLFPDTGTLIVSLDFEMYWGIHDVMSYNLYEDALSVTPEVVHQLLSIFKKYDVHVTWATVGLLFCGSVSEAEAYSNKIAPTYNDRLLSATAKLQDLSKEGIDHALFAPGLVNHIMATSGQELATHTFSHYYCMEPGQTVEQFEADIRAAVIISERLGNKLKSIVFPRNQARPDYLQACLQHGIICYRGNENSIFYRAQALSDEPLWKRAGRLLDSYLNITGHHTYKALKESNCMINLPASRFLRPYSKRLSLLEPLKMKRIKKSMTHAAEQAEVYHLWWHPHNFGRDTRQNFEQLTELLNHYQYLKKVYGFQSLNMGELCETL